MKGLHGTSWQCGEARSPQSRDQREATVSRGASSTGRLVENVLERLRLAAPRLGLSERELAAEAIDRFLEEEGF